ncbi:MAG TPA: hypothetical protein PLZ22_03575 [Thermotogota bacterium]|nr:hypothetical protein [Thermotogota bacterium]HPH10487.1 hypothetical protein [Thermotogota bacterium]HPM20699.1 hypothetical protein [Thermotogota bacterium]
MKSCLCILFLLSALGFSVFGMLFEIGTGYRFAPFSFANHGWNLDLGLFNQFNDMLSLDVTYHPQFSFNESGEREATPTNYLNFDLDAMIPLLGRRETKEGYRFGLFGTFEFGNFYDTYKNPSETSSDFSNWEVWQNSSYWLGAGLYAQYYLRPWMFQLGIGFPIIRSPDTLNTMDWLLGTVEFKTRFFIESERHAFKDHLTVEIEISARKVGISVCLIEPF